MTPRKYVPSALRLTAIAAITAALTACATSGDAPTVTRASATGQTATNSQGPARLIGGHSLEVFIGAYDVNRDGVVSRAEYDSVLNGQFRAADTNGDGVLSEAEHVAEFEARFKGQMQRDGRALSDNDQAMVMKQAHRRFRIIDANGDGSITSAEAHASADAAYRRWDANGDGSVNASDKREAATQASDSRSQDTGAAIDNFIANYDTNGDSVVTRAEYVQVREQRFATADTNRDGWLSEAEYVKEFEQRLRSQQRTVGANADADAFARQMKQAQRRYRLLDANSDGRLTKAEALARADQTFQSSDRNRDGAVTRADAQANDNGPSLSVEAFLRTYDDAGQGRVTRAQYDQLRQQRFAAADGNRDGSLTEDEFVAEYAGRLKQQYQRAGKPLDKQTEDAAIKQTRTRFGVLDTNKDARLSKQEALGFSDRFFRNADLNGDGTVDAADQALQAQRANRSGRTSSSTQPNPATFTKVKPVQHQQGKQ